MVNGTITWESAMNQWLSFKTTSYGNLSLWYNYIPYYLWDFLTRIYITVLWRYFNVFITILSIATPQTKPCNIIVYLTSIETGKILGETYLKYCKELYIKNTDKVCNSANPTWVGFVHMYEHCYLVTRDVFYVKFHCGSLRW